MSNVVAFTPRRRPDPSQGLATLLDGVATHRARPDDVFWLKENAEILNVLAACGANLSDAALAPYAEFYDGLEERLRFFPQYYRFFLSICLDLEALGLKGRKGQSLCDWVAATGLADAELSDLQRAEARRLLARRGAAAPVSDGALGARLRQFAARPQTFALPNRKAAYELAHIVFYLSEYGSCDPQLDAVALHSLENTGLVAYLDQDHDLLAEICIALRFAGVTPSPIWTDAVARAHRAILPEAGECAVPGGDGFHAWLVTGWAERVAGQGGFAAAVPEGPLTFADRRAQGGALRALSSCLYDLGGARSGDWTGMRRRILPFLDQASLKVLQDAEASTERFGEFFEGFARATGT